MRPLLLALACPALLVLAGCAFPVDPDAATFNCAADADCGAGQICVKQVATGQGLCFAAGACTSETCNGQDDDCDGVADDHVPGSGSACAAPTGATVCALGVTACLDGALRCVGQVLARPEACDGVSDLDCDGKLGCDDPDCEGLAACGPGCVCQDTARHETDCANGLDDDGDGRTDCLDADCLGRACLAGGGGTCGTDGACAP